MTRLTFQRYLDHLGDDGNRFAAAARAAGPDAIVSTCPGWTVSDLVTHLADVFAHKSATMRLGRPPQPKEFDWDPLPGEVDNVPAYERQLAELVAELSSRGPGARTWTWVPGEETVAFWFRRMAHEAAIHRVDAELAAGLPVGQVAADLAVDGVDEVLTWFAGHPEVLQYDRGGVTGSVVVVAGDAESVVQLADDVHEVAAVTGENGDARIEGTAHDVYLDLWGRPTDVPVRTQGDPDLLARLRRRLHMAASD